MKWNSVVDGFPKDRRLLVTYLEPFFGIWTTEVTQASYNEDGQDENNMGWHDSLTNNKILVTHWMEPIVPAEHELKGQPQTREFINEVKGHPNYGTVVKLR
jgi:hypothetical protein